MTSRLNQRQCFMSLFIRKQSIPSPQSQYSDAHFRQSRIINRDRNNYSDLHIMLPLTVSPIPYSSIRSNIMTEVSKSTGLFDSIQTNSFVSPMPSHIQRSSSTHDKRLHFLQDELKKHNLIKILNDSLHRSNPGQDDDPEKQGGANDSLFNNDFLIAVGYATSCLRTTIPHFFSHGLQDDSIYANNVLFSDPFATRICVRGKLSYRTMAETFRVAMNCYYSDVQVQIIGIRQVDSNTLAPISPYKKDVPNETKPLQHPDSTTDRSQERSKALDQDPRLALQVRWIFTGRPRIKLIGSILDRMSRPSSEFSSQKPLSFPLSRPNSSLQDKLENTENGYTNPDIVEYQGIFLYRFNSQGRISEHSIQTIYPCPPIVTWFLSDDTIAPSSPSSF